ncbi:hypothetical protein BCR44DRAFT_1440400 [Catenaria anguillulae PL171]|uniref:Uncharacterized protein n=1 Tax=Catenaria anguillulae PL171 TaxID=765915 RepID=A0A1Y2HD02_9FUNG|nr:hypothetical protein BCR44DRAFT_1440400 [Catenaria anguillulae PL171]
MLAASNLIQMQHPQSQSPPPTAPAHAAVIATAAPITSTRVARAIAELNTKYPTHRFSAKPDGGLVIDEIATGERATSCPDPECARVFAYKRSNCVSRHVQTEHAPDTLPFVCCSPCTSRTNRRDHFVAHLARKKAQCAAAILARWNESDIDLMMKLVYPNAARQGYGAWRQALVHDTNPEHLEAQLRKLGMSINDVLGQAETPSVTPSATPIIGTSAAAASGMLPPMPVSPLTHAVPVSMPSTSMSAPFAPAPGSNNNNFLVPDWATLTPPPPPPAVFMSDMPMHSSSYQPQFSHPQAQFPALASTAWESWPPAPAPAPTQHAFHHQPMLAPHAAPLSSPMIPTAPAAGSMTPDPQLPAFARFDFDPSPFLSAQGTGIGALPSPATSPMTLASSAAMPMGAPTPTPTPMATSVAVNVNGLMSPTVPVAPTSRKRSRSAAQVDESVSDYDALLFGYAPASSHRAASHLQSGNGDSTERQHKRFRVSGSTSNDAGWLQLPSPVLAPVALVQGESY